MHNARDACCSLIKDFLFCANRDPEEPRVKPPNHQALNEHGGACHNYFGNVDSSLPSSDILGIHEADLPLDLKMRTFALATAFLSAASIAFCTENLTKPLTSRILLPSNFKPSQSFKNVNLLHAINLEKSYPKESINVVIENIASTAQDEYFLPFTARQMETIGGLEVKDRKDPESGLFEVDAVEFDPQRYYKQAN
jgi:hypothetical protein